MAMEIRMASYNPSGKDNSTGNEIWVDKDGVAITAANNKKFMKGIQIAKTNEIMIEMDLHGDAAASKIRTVLLNAAKVTKLFIINLIALLKQFLG